MAAKDYVNENAGLKVALKRMQDNPDSSEAKYWKDRTGGSLSVEAFGTAHAKETNALIKGTYTGKTEVPKGEDTSFARRAIPQLEKGNMKDDSITATTESVRQKEGETTQYSPEDLAGLLGASPFLHGAASGGKNIYAGTQSAKDYEDYVNTYPDLQRAWRTIVSNPYSEEARYWIPRMGVQNVNDISIDKFGMAHQAENSALVGGDYVGQTDIRPGTPDYIRWLEGKNPTTGQRDPTSDYWKGKTLDPNETTSVVDTTDVTDTSLLDYTGPPGGLGTAVGGLMATTPYTQPAPQDWSNLRYTYAGSPQSELGQVTQTPASQAMFGPQGRAMQPWATGQQVPAGLLNYQIPGGAPANVSYSGGNPSLFDFNQQQNNQQLNNQTNQQVDWAGVPVRTMGVDGVMGYDPEGVPYKDFEDFTARTHQQYYPGRQDAAMAAGFGGINYFAPGAAKWRASLPGGATSADWIDQYGSAAEQADGTFRTATQQLIDSGLITAKGK